MQKYFVRIFTTPWYGWLVATPRQPKPRDLVVLILWIVATLCWMYIWDYLRIDTRIRRRKRQPRVNTGWGITKCRPHRRIDPSFLRQEPESAAAGDV